MSVNLDGNTVDVYSKDELTGWGVSLGGVRVGLSVYF
jgi:hypothetical protein